VCFKLFCDLLHIIGGDTLGFRPPVHLIPGRAARSVIQFPEDAEYDVLIILRGPGLLLGLRGKVDLVRELALILGQTQIDVVIGEEDLALIPAVLLAPMGTDIVYGWPGRCMMRITTDEGIRSKMEHLVSKMEEAE